jgi:hypothetical protein
MRSLTVRVQYDPECRPVRLWWFDVDAHAQSWFVPLSTGVPELIEVASNGYAAHEFVDCELGRKYGLRWQWNPVS